MSLKNELLIGLWIVAGLFSLYIGAMTLKYPDAAWARAAENFRRRGLAAKRTARWERSRVFTGALSLCIGTLLLGLAGWVGFQQHADATPATQQMSYIDPATGKSVTRTLTVEQVRKLHENPAAFMRDDFPSIIKKP